MDDCSQNALCVSLPPEVRRRLCENCIKASYAQDTIMPIDTNHPIVIVEGIVLVQSLRISRCCSWPRARCC